MSRVLLVSLGKIYPENKMEKYKQLALMLEQLISRIEVRIAETGQPCATESQPAVDSLKRLSKKASFPANKFAARQRSPPARTDVPQPAKAGFVALRRIYSLPLWIGSKRWSESAMSGEMPPSHGCAGLGISRGMSDWDIFDDFGALPYQIDRFYQDNFRDG